jgi:hypothetical protein
MGHMKELFTSMQESLLEGREIEREARERALTEEEQFVIYSNLTTKIDDSDRD